MTQGGWLTENEQSFVFLVDDFIVTNFGVYVDLVHLNYFRNELVGRILDLVIILTG